MQRRTTANSSRTAETEDPSPLSVRVPSDPPTPRNPVTQRLFDSDAEYQKDAKIHKTTLQGASFATTLRAALQSAEDFSFCDEDFSVLLSNSKCQAQTLLPAALAN